MIVHDPRTGVNGYRYAHLPANLDLSAVTKPAWADYGAWLVDAVIDRTASEKGAAPDTFVPMAAAYVNRFIPARNRKPLITDLTNGGVLECNNFYFFNPYYKGGSRGDKGECLCYRLGPAFRGAKLRPHPLRNPELDRNMGKFWREQYDTVKDPVHRALRAWVEAVEVTPDAPEGEHHTLNKLIEGVRRFHVCDKGRVHTAVANLPVQYRRFIRMDGRELADVDISTSQPLLLALLLRRRLADAGGKTNAVYVHCLNRYLNDCLDGTVYDRVVDLTGYPRGDVKPMFLAVIYGAPGDMFTKVGRAVRKLYPGVFDAVVELYEELGHGALPCLMQRAESDVMIRRVCGRFLRERPEMPVLTIHDGIIVHPENVGYVRGVILDEWRAEFGIEPNLKTSDFTAPQEKRNRRPRRGGRRSSGKGPRNGGRR